MQVRAALERSGLSVEAEAPRDIFAELEAFDERHRAAAPLATASTSLDPTLQLLAEERSASELGRTEQPWAPEEEAAGPAEGGVWEAAGALRPSTWSARSLTKSKSNVRALTFKQRELKVAEEGWHKARTWRGATPDLLGRCSFGVSCACIATQLAVADAQHSLYVIQKQARAYTFDKSAQ